MLGMLKFAFRAALGSYSGFLYARMGDCFNVLALAAERVDSTTAPRAGRWRLVWSVWTAMDMAYFRLARIVTDGVGCIKGDANLQLVAKPLMG